MKKVVEKAVLLNSCDVLPIYNFYAVSEHNDLLYLISGYDGTNKKDVEDAFTNKELSDTYKDLINEYNELTVNREALVKAKLLFALMTKKTIYDAVSRILNLYKTTSDIEVLVLLNEFGFKISRLKPLGSQIDAAIKRLKGLRNKIRIDEANFKAKYAKESKNDEVKHLIRDLDKQALSLELALSTGYNINVRKTTVTRWINLVTLANNRSKKNG